MTGIEQFLHDVIGAREQLAATGVDLGRSTVHTGETIDRKGHTEINGCRIVYLGCDPHPSYDRIHYYALISPQRVVYLGRSAQDLIICPIDRVPVRLLALL